MGRQPGEPTAVGSSSIALLQERFRQLDKMREKREERELLRLFSGPEQIITQTKCFEPVNISSQPEEIFPSRPPLQDSLSFGLNIYSRHAEYRSMKSSPLTNFWSIDATTVSTSGAHDKPEVDTSLHL